MRKLKRVTGFCLAVEGAALGKKMHGDLNDVQEPAM